MRPVILKSLDFEAIQRPVGARNPPFQEGGGTEGFRGLKIFFGGFFQIF